MLYKIYTGFIQIRIFNRQHFNIIIYTPSVHSHIPCPIQYFNSLLYLMNSTNYEAHYYVIFSILPSDCGTHELLRKTGPSESNRTGLFRNTDHTHAVPDSVQILQKVAYSVANAS
jgi:hypothetical protein